MMHHSVSGSAGIRTLRRVSLLLLLYAGLTASTFGQAPSTQRRPTVRSGKSETLTTTVKGELVKGKTIDLEGNVALIFKTGPETYSTLKPEFEDLLIEKPAMDCPEGLAAKILDLRVSKCDIDVLTGVGEGYSIHCKVQIATEANVKPGNHTLLVALPAVSAIAKVMKATSPTEPPIYTFEAKVYESEEALANAKAAEEKARQAYEAAQRKQAEAEAAELARRNRQLQYIVGGVAAAFVVLFFFGWYSRPWVAPTYRVNLRRGTSTTIAGSFTRNRAINSSQINDDPEFVDQTYWARDFWSKRADVKVQVVSESAQRTVTETVATSTNESGAKSSSSSFSAETKYQVTIRLAAGSGVSPGRYVARTEAGSLLINVR